MTLERQEILRSKRSLRGRLTSLPIGERLPMLDILRDRSAETEAVRVRLRAGGAGRPAVAGSGSTGRCSRCGARASATRTPDVAFR